MDRRTRRTPSDKEGRGALLDAANLQLSEDDNVLVQGVLGDTYAIGYFGYAYYVENADKLNGVVGRGCGADRGDGGCGEYPLARPLFIYTDGESCRTSRRWRRSQLLPDST